MSMYTMIMGRNPFCPLLLGAVGITSETIEQYPLGRIRDAYTNSEGTKVFVLHRNYGDEGEGKRVNDAIAKNPNFVRQYQVTPEENTYQIWEFNVPPQYQVKMKEIASMSDNTPCFEAFLKVIKDMGEGRILL